MAPGDPLSRVFSADSNEVAAARATLAKVSAVLYKALHLLDCCKSKNGRLGRRSVTVAPRRSSKKWDSQSVKRTEDARPPNVSAVLRAPTENRNLLPNALLAALLIIPEVQARKRGKLPGKPSASVTRELVPLLSSLAHARDPRKN